jgi:hypothetical protein
MLLFARLFVVCVLVFPLPAASGPGVPFRERGAAQAGADPQARGEWLAREIEHRPAGRDARFEMRMKLYDRQGRARERGLTMLALRGRDKPGAGPGAPAGDRVLLRFSYPSDIKGTAFLVRDRPGEDDERFLYLPALGRVRRIAGSERQESFVGSDFTYEDVGGRRLEDYTYRMLDEQAAWQAPDGRSHPAYRLESRARDRDAAYPRVVSLVRKDALVVVHAEIHDRRDAPRKTFDVRRLEPVQNVWTALDMVMVNALERTRTELTVASARYDVGFRDEDFSRRELERPER